MAETTISDHFRELLELFAAHGVEFLVVGALAQAAHGRPRYTGDLDVFVAASRENGERIVAAMREFGFASLKLKPEDFDSADTIIQLGRPPHRIDIITGISGVTWDEAWSSREERRLGALNVKVPSPEVLLRNKLASGRSKDLADADTLRKIIDERRARASRTEKPR